jgi:hypothetical protein
MPTDNPHVASCFRCAGLAEQPAVASGHVAGDDVEQLPLCVECLELLLTNAGGFWRPLRQRRGDAGG